MEIKLNAKQYEALEYLLDAVVWNLSDLIEEVIYDSEEDPHYSAVTANNLLICNIIVRRLIGRPPPYNNMKEYFNSSHYSQRDYKIFEKKWTAEKPIYLGKQWDVSQLEDDA